MTLGGQHFLLCPTTSRQPGKRRSSRGAGGHKDNNKSHLAKSHTLTMHYKGAQMSISGEHTSK
eukprot:1158671-Pelagomonas_calceolata.AAC.3